MTIRYDSKDHIRLIFGIEGSVTFVTVKSCVFVSVIYIIIICINEYILSDDNPLLGDSEDESENGAYIIYLMLLMLLIVIYTNTALKRYEEGSELLAKFAYECETFGTRVVIHTYFDESLGADKWREEVNRLMIMFVNTSLEYLKEESSSSGSSASRYLLEGTIIYNRSQQEGPYEFLQHMTDIVSQNQEYLKNSVPIQVEMLLLNQISDISMTLTKMYTLSTTQIPFIFANIVNILCFLLMLFIPFGSNDYKISFLPFIWMIIYAIVGLFHVSAEISDPFGKGNINDLDIDLHQKRIIAKINKTFTKENVKDLFEELEETDCEEGNSNSSADCEEGNSNSTAYCESLEADNDNQYEKLGQDELRALHRYSNFASDPAQIVSNIENIGDMYVERKLYDEAISYYDKALISFSNTSLNCQSDNYFRVKNKVCDIYFTELNLDRALQEYRLLSKWEVTENCKMKKRAYIHHRIGMILYYKCEYSSALDEFWLGIKSLRKYLNYDSKTYWDITDGLNEMDLVELAVFLYCLGLVHNERKEYNFTLRRLTESLALQRQIATREDISLLKASTIAKISRAHRKLGEKAECKAYKQLGRLTSLGYQENDSYRKGLSNLDSTHVESNIAIWETTCKIITAKAANEKMNYESDDESLQNVPARAGKRLYKP